MAERLIPPAAKIAAAKKKYASRLCRGYLEVPESACEKVFDVLYDEMKKVFQEFARA